MKTRLCSIRSVNAAVKSDSIKWQLTTSNIDVNSHEWKNGKFSQVLPFYLHPIFIFASGLAYGAKLKRRNLKSPRSSKRAPILPCWTSDCYHISSHFHIASIDSKSSWHLMSRLSRTIESYLYIYHRINTPWCFQNRALRLSNWSHEHCTVDQIQSIQKDVCITLWPNCTGTCKCAWIMNTGEYF